MTTLKPLTVLITTNWKILKEMRIPDHLPCLLTNLPAGQEATVSTWHETIDWFQTGKRVHQSCILPLCFSMQSISCQMLGWMKHKLESRLLVEISVSHCKQMTSPLWQKAKRNWKNLLMKVKRETGETGLKTLHSKNKDYGIRPHHIMENRWRNNGNSDRLYFLGLQNHCGQWLQPWN